jgi:hypothetical protein
MYLLSYEILKEERFPILKGMDPSRPLSNSEVCGIRRLKAERNEKSWRMLLVDQLNFPSTDDRYSQPLSRNPDAREAEEFRDCYYEPP